MSWRYSQYITNKYSGLGFWGRLSVSDFDEVALCVLQLPLPIDTSMCSKRSCSMVGRLSGYSRRRSFVLAPDEDHDSLDLKIQLAARRWTEAHAFPAGCVVYANGLSLVVAVADGFVGSTEWSLIDPDAVLGSLRR